MKVLVVARLEFLAVVRRFGFFLVTFAMLVFNVVSVLLVYPQVERSLIDDLESAPASSAMSPGEVPVLRARPAERDPAIGFVDESGVILLPVPRDQRWTRYPDRDTARATMAQTNIANVFVLPPDYLETGRVDLISTKRPAPIRNVAFSMPGRFRDFLRENLLVGVDAARAKRALRVNKSGVYEWLSPTGERVFAEPLAQTIPRVVGGVGAAILLFMSIALTGGYLIQGMSDEKDNRVLEIVLASLEPVELMAGKLLGLGSAGLVQVTLWAAVAVGLSSALGGGLVMSPKLLLLSGLFFMLGYALIGSLLLGIGSLGSNQREATQYTAFVSLLCAGPIFVLMPIVDEPSSKMAVILSYFPLTAPVTMLLRLGVDPSGVPGTQIFFSLAILAVSVVLALRGAARLFRVGLLMYGKQPTAGEIFKWFMDS